MSQQTPPKILIQAVILLLLSVVLYSNTFTHDYNLDDVLITEQLPAPSEGFKGTFSVFSKIYDEADYRPVAAFTFALENWIMNGPAPHVSHVVNTILFFLCCLMLLLCLRQLPIQNSHWLAFIAALLFAVHPIHSNVVSSLKNRDNLFSFLFGFAALWIVLRSFHHRYEPVAKDVLIKSIHFVIALGFFLIGTMAKQDIISFMFIIPLAYIMFTKVQWKALFALPMVFLFYKAFTYFRFELINRRMLDIPSLEQPIMITENPLIQHEGLLSKAGLGLTSIFYYLKFHFIPTGYFYYFGFDMIPVGNLWHPFNIISMLAILLSSAAFFYYLKKQPALSFGIGIFFFSLAYCSNLYMPVAGIVAPRLAFIASAGFSIALASILLMISDWVRKRNPIEVKKGEPASTDTFDAGHKTLLIMTIAIILVLAPFTFQRNAAWKDIKTLIDTDIPHLGRSFEAQRIASTNYFQLAEANTDPLKKRAYMSRSLELGKSAHEVYDKDIIVEETIGLAMYLLGDIEDARVQFEKVIGDFQESTIGWDILGQIYGQQGSHEESANFYRVLIDRLPEEGVPYYRYTEAMIAAGKPQEAALTHEFLTEAHPDLPFAYESIGYLSMYMGDTLRSAIYFFYALDKGSQNMQYYPVLEEYYMRTGNKEKWDLLLAGWRPGNIGPDPEH